jgi:hypothetical protein
LRLLPPERRDVTHRIADEGCGGAVSIQRLANGMTIFTLGRRMGTSVAVIDATYGHLARDADGNDRELLDVYDELNGHEVGTNPGENEDSNLPQNDETAP